MALNVIQRVAIYLGALWAALAVVVVRFVFGRPWSWVLAAVVVVELLWLLYGYSIRWIGNSGVRAIPGPAPALFSGHWPRVVNDYGPLYREAWHSHGSAKAGGHGVFKLFFGRTPRIVVGDLDLITRVANADFLNFDGRPGALYRARQISMLLQIRGPLWHRIRSAMLPAFSYHNMKGIHPHLITATGRMRDDIKRFKADDKIDLMSMWASMTVEAIGLLAFGTDLRQNNAKPPGLVEASADGKAEVINEHPLVSATKRVLPLLRFAINDTAVVMSAFPFLRAVLMGVCGKKILKKSVETWEHLDALTGEIVKKRRADPQWDQQNDLLTRILEAKDTDGKALTDYEVLDQVNTFLIAGYETMASTLGYTSLLLAQNPDKEAKLVAEIDRLYEQYGTEPDLDALTEYEYAEAVLKESMRLYTPAIMTRTPTPTPAGDAKIAPKGSGVVYPLPTGLVMHMGSAIVHYDEKHFPDPTAFRPERWLADDPENAKRDKHAWMAFGFGPRGCIGLRLAMTECKLALVQVYRNFTFRIHRDTQLPPQLVAGVTHVPKSPLFATVQPRAR